MAQRSRSVDGERSPRAPSHVAPDSGLIAFGEQGSRRVGGGEHPDGDGEQHWLIRAKFDPPRQVIRIVDRPQVLRRLDQFLGHRICFVVAPAGFGKTTALAEWRLHQLEMGSIVAWLTLDEADGEPHQFLSYVISALCAAGLDLGWLEPLAEQGLADSTVQAALSAMVATLQRVTQPVILVLDDYHRIGSPDVDLVIEQLVSIAPANLTLVLNSRTQPRLNAPKLLTSGIAMELGPESLRFTKAEVVQAIDLPLTEAQFELVYETTEGWPVAVQLSRLLMPEDTAASLSLERLAGDSGHVASYLMDQVLAQLPDDAQLFLMQTAILERFDPSLANAVTGRSDGRQALRRLEHLNALIVPTGASSFRYHHLLAECLLDLLHQRDDEDVRNLHLRASAWYEAKGNVAEAVRHAREADDFERCAQLIQTAGGWELILFGGIGYLRNLLRNIPEDAVRAHPRLLVAKAYLWLKDGRILDARAYVDAARSASSNGLAHEALARDLVNVTALLDAYEDRHSSLADSDRLRAHIARHSEADPLTIAVLTCKLVLTELGLGRLPEAERLAQDAMRSMRLAQTMLGLNYCYLHAGLAALYQGRCRIAEAHFGVARRMAEDNCSSDPGLKALSHFLLGVLRHWQGRMTPTEYPEFLEHFEHVEHYDGWFELYANGLNVEAEFSPDQAIDRARRIAETRGMPRLVLLADALRLRSRAGADLGEDLAAHRLEQVLPDGIWRRDPFMWRPFIESRLALAQHSAGRSRSAAIRHLDHAIEACRATGAAIFLVEALAFRAVLLDQAGSRPRALQDTVEALCLAAPEGICLPFNRMREIVPLLRAVIRMSRENHVDILAVGFANELLLRLEGSYARVGFSPREQEVLDELAQDRSNKEIARALDMTEHTVKFHLKHIFSKLQVDCRAQAIAWTRRVN